MMPRRLGLGCGAIFLAILGAGASANAQEAYFEVESISASETLGISGILNGFESDTPEDSGKFTFTHNRALAGIRYGGFDIALLSRYDYNAVYTPETAEVLIASANGFELEDGDLSLSARVKRAAAFGARTGYRHSFFSDRLEIGAFISGFWATELIDGGLSGFASLSHDGDFIDGEVDVDYFYQSDLIFDREVEASEGFGLSVDVEVALALTDRLKARVEIGDAWSRTWWDDAPRTVLDASLTTLTRDNQGLISVRPLIQGINTIEDTETRYRVRTDAMLGYQVSDRWTVSQDVYNIDSLTLTTSRVRFDLSNTLALSTEFEWTFQALGFSVEWHGLKAGLTSDRFDVTEAQYLRGFLAYHYQF